MNIQLANFINFNVIPCDKQVFFLVYTAFKVQNQSTLVILYVFV